MFQLLPGGEAAKSVLAGLKPKLAALKAAGISCRLNIILASDNPSSKSYVERKIKAGTEIGIDVALQTYSHSISQYQLLAEINKFNNDPLVHGIICQLPLSKDIDPNQIALNINSTKDVDCFNPVNLGRLAIGKAYLKPGTAAGILYLLSFHKISTSGKNMLIIGRSNIVGKPLAIMAMQPAVNATVSIAHLGTDDLSTYTAIADIIVVAAGHPKLLGKQKFKPSAVIIDVGINKTSAGNIVGDLDLEELQNKVAAISPVPGGVGPLTVAMLMQNTVEACIWQTRARGIKLNISGS